MDDIQLRLLIDLHKQEKRQGPGGEAETRLALRLARLDHSNPLKIADIGCGTGASTIVLANELNARIHAIDFAQEFLDILQCRAKNQGVEEKITMLNCSMDALPYSDEEFDVIWSEGAVYNIGFEKGVSAWNRFLKPGGKLIVSEMIWLCADRPVEIQSYWKRECPEIDLASAKISILEQYGYRPEGYFVLPPHCWMENYYLPLQRRFQRFLEDHDHSVEAKRIVELEREEAALYENYRGYYSYGVYIAEKIRS